MKHIPPFSKEMYEGDTVSNKDGFHREGFLDNVDIHKCAEREPRKGLADFQEQPPGLAPNSSYPDFKKRSDDGIPATPAPFSKTSIKGGPKKPGTPA